jgi:hypothetical protein
MPSNLRIWEGGIGRTTDRERGESYAQGEMRSRESSFPGSRLGKNSKTGPLAKNCGRTRLCLPKSAAAARNRHRAARSQTRPWAAAEPVLPAAEREPSGSSEPEEVLRSSQPAGGQQGQRGRERRTTEPEHNTTELAHNRTEPERSRSAAAGAAERSRSGPGQHSHKGPGHRSHNRTNGDGNDGSSHIRSRTHIPQNGGRRGQCPYLQPRETLRPQWPESTSCEASAISSSCGTLVTRTL